MNVKIGKFTLGLRSATVHIENFVLENTAEFGGETFVDMPELFIEYDRDALRSGKLHLKRVRISINKVHVVENQEGKRNADELQKHQGKTKSRNAPSNENEPKLAFTGVDMLDVSIRTVQFTSFKNRDQNLEHDLEIRHEVFKNLKTDQDFQTAAALLALKAGGSLWLSGEFPNLGTLLMRGSKAGKETKNILEGLSAPLPKQQMQPEAQP